MNKDYIRYLNKVKHTNNAYHPTRMRLRKKLGISSDDFKQSSIEIINLLDNVPNKLIQNIKMEACVKPQNSIDYLTARGSSKNSIINYSNDLDEFLGDSDD